jgi:hypothetical protein
MAFTGDLELLNIVDIIQLLSSTRKSGTFSVRGGRGESRLIFSNGYIVGASHLNNRVRIGTVLARMNVITPHDLEEALEAQERAGKDRKPLIATLIELGKLGRDDAARGLKKLIEMTIVELVGWTTGTFTLDTEAIAVSPECSYPLSKMEQDIGLDAQMVLMDALRILDERERDRQSGKTVPSDEELFGDIIPSQGPVDAGGNRPVVTADDLGLGDLDRLERKMPQYIEVNEVFDPAEIHRQKIKETLAAFPAEEQNAFVSFLEKFGAGRGGYVVPRKQEGRTRALVLFSEDELIKHSVMTICRAEDILVFATDGEEELCRIMDQCLKMKVLPVLVFDTTEATEGIVSPEKIVSLRQKIKVRHNQVPVIQMASPMDYPFMLQSFHDGVRAVLPKPSQEARKETFIEDTMGFLEAFKVYISGLLLEQRCLDEVDNQMSTLKGRILALQDLHEPSAVPLALLNYVSEICERAITFMVRPAELTGEKAIGVFAERKDGPTSVTSLKIPLTEPSVFREVISKGQLFYGEGDDKVLKEHLFQDIGEPLSPTIILLPVKTRGKTVTMTYGDFGAREASPVQADALEILANEAGLILDNVLYRKQLSKASQR